MNNTQTNQPLSLEWLIASGQEVTEEKLQAAQQAQKYEGRERIPEPLLWMADLYNELTGQEPTKRVASDWMFTFDEWKQEKLQAEHIRAAWEKANEPNGFHVGRPGALTNTAVAIRSKSIKTPALQINTERIEATRQLIAQKEQEFHTPPTAETLASSREHMQAVRARWASEEAERNKRK